MQPSVLHVHEVRVVASGWVGRNAVRRTGLQVEPDTKVNGRVISTMFSPEFPIPMRLLEPGVVADTSPLTGNIHDLVSMPPPSEDRAAA